MSNPIIYTKEETIDLGVIAELRQNNSSVTIKGRYYTLISQDGTRCGEEVEVAEDADLIRVEFIKYYRLLGRRKFWRIVKANKGSSHAEMRDIFKFIQTDYTPADGAQVMR